MMCSLRSVKKSVGKVSISAVKRKSGDFTLYLLAKLPPKPGSRKDENHQQRIALGLKESKANLKIAEKQRAILQRQLDGDTFQWSDWIDTDATTLKWREAINELYRKRVTNGRTGETTWQVNYMGRLRQIPMSEAVTPNTIRKALEKYRREQCSYKELYYLLKEIAVIAKVSFPEVPVPTYNSARDASHDVPSDKQIIEWVQAMPSAESRWTLGMMATYGLRDHETIDCRFLDDQHTLFVRDTKHNPPLEREVIPVRPEWVKLFDLRNEQRKDFSKLRQTISQWLFVERKKLDTPTWKPYVLRHAYAGRLWNYGRGKLDVYTAATMMGHTMAVHEKTYRSHIDRHKVADRARTIIAEALMEES